MDPKHRTMESLGRVVEVVYSRDGAENSRRLCKLTTVGNQCPTPLVSAHLHGVLRMGGLEIGKEDGTETSPELLGGNHYDASFQGYVAAVGNVPLDTAPFPQNSDE